MPSSVSTTEALAGCSRGAEQALLLHRDVHAGRLHLGQRGDGAGEFALERPAIVDVLEELGLAERDLVEDLEADASTARHALAGKLQAKGVGAAGGHEDGPPAILQPVVDVVGRQAIDDLGRLFAVEVAEEHAILGAIEVPGRADQQGDHAHEDGDQRDQLAAAERGAHRLALLDDGRPLHGKEGHGVLELS